MARRGDQLREHILWTAKDVFLELGFERASMDVLAARAATSKRTLYAHFDNKDTLFLAVVGFVRELHQGRLLTPDRYGVEPVEAVAVYCARYLQSLIWVQSVRTCRLVIAEAERMPQAAAEYFDAIFAATRGTLAAFLGVQYGVSEDAATRTADEILSRAVYPQFVRALFGVEELPVEWPDDPPNAADPELGRIREIVTEVLDGRRC